MKINFSDYDLTEFYIKEGDFMGIPAKLITPKITAKWTKDNIIFRSSVWDLDGNLLSAGFKKFTNAGENPEVFPLPESLDKTHIVTKYDGSLAIFDYIDGKLSIRTRGTMSYKQLDNSPDFDYCLEKYPNILRLSRASIFSLLCEITTPNQQIILNYGDKPDLTLVGCVDKVDYSLVTQSNLDMLAESLGIKRPEYHNANNLDELVAYVKPRKDIEGICLYSNDGQTIHKIKADYYLRLHRLKSDISSFDKVVELYFSLGQPDYQGFYDTVKSTFDFELAEYAKENIRAVTNLAQQLREVIQNISEKVLTLQGLSRKDAALEIIKLYQADGLSSFAFTLLNKRPIEQKHLVNWICEQHKKIENAIESYKPYIHLSNNNETDTLFREKLLYGNYKFDKCHGSETENL